MEQKICTSIYNKFVNDGIFLCICANYTDILSGSHNGGEASNTFLAMQKMDKEELEKWREHLLRYCELDTFAMVKVLEKLREVGKC